MIDTDIAKNLLLGSIHDLENKISLLSDDDYAAEIINVTCQYFIEKSDKYVNGANAMLYFQNNFSNLNQEVSVFISSIKKDYPYLLTPSNIQNLTQNICLNLGWNGMKDFLNDYFYKKHGKILDTSEEHYEFSSSFHKRLESDNCIEMSNVDRQISVTLSNDRKCIAVSITPSLTLKVGNLKYQNDNVYKYEGKDPDYLFEFHFDSFGDISFFALELLSRKLRIEYFE